MIPLQMLLAALLAWLEAEPRDVIAFLREENRVLKAQLSKRRLRLNDDQRPAAWPRPSGSSAASG